ncbi:prolyl oligopeptidase family serine peptidase [Sphingomonas changnyeongensis]|uniref:Prolyl oligopeptidase family serine peptidase n=1 Tax=Sphingomonas changnyeongensis TaxID=2698679 RepID=A0A7Z2NW49_9SPHN|nr:acyl-CoA thioester hydrolase/BAAT C-terminal domain-containing protein [Sphingomonas changnyeongensis]QHL90504.1 prolyl oligopeptidase family serine peptidase [Sphingomonas changnyeongensis]
MKWKNGAMVAAGIAALLGGAAMFRALAPQRYGLPEIEVLAPGATGQRISRDGLFGNYFPAPGPGPHPAVLLLGGSEGGLGRATLQMALMLQKQGFAVFQLAYFGAPGQPEALERIPLELFDRGLDWLKAQPGVDPERLAVMGASKGAEAALLVASRRPDLSAVVAGMPTSVAWNGVNWARSGQSAHSSWTVGGREVATMPFAEWNQADGIISVYRAVEDPAQRQLAERAAIPVERARARLLLVCGEAETMWPACPMSRMVDARSRRQGGPPVTLLAYKDAGHFVFGPPVAPGEPFYRRLDAYGGTVAGNAAARADSWPKVIAFLKQPASAGTAARPH